MNVCLYVGLASQTDLEYTFKIDIMEKQGL